MLAEELETGRKKALEDNYALSRRKTREEVEEVEEVGTNGRIVPAGDKQAFFVKAGFQLRERPELQE